jgi:hypothetical protein
VHPPFFPLEEEQTKSAVTQNRAIHVDATPFRASSMIDRRDRAAPSAVRPIR